MCIRDSVYGEARRVELTLRRIGRLERVNRQDAESAKDLVVEPSAEFGDLLTVSSVPRSMCPVLAVAPWSRLRRSAARGTHALQRWHRECCPNPMNLALLAAWRFDLSQ